MFCCVWFYCSTWNIAAGYGFNAAHSQPMDCMDAVDWVDTMDSVNCYKLAIVILGPTVLFAK